MRTALSKRVAMSGIYRIRDHKDRSYIGSSTDVRARWRQHRSALEQGKHHSIVLQRAWTKYGAEFFTFEFLQAVENPSELIPFEQYWIDVTKPHYNAALQVAGGKSNAAKDRQALKRLDAELNADIEYEREYENAKLRCDNFLIVLRRGIKADPAKIEPSTARRFEELFARAKLGYDPFDVLDDTFWGAHAAIIYLAKHSFIDKITERCDTLIQKHESISHTE
jgi:hypothetical protein